MNLKTIILISEVAALGLETFSYISGELNFF
jgi:hypothetical protein